LSEIHIEGKTGEVLFQTLPVASTPDGSEISIRLAVMKGLGEGPVLSVFGGVHGNEYEGPLAIRRVTKEVDPSEIRGTLICVPVANIPAYALSVRDNPLDQKNLARVFPGRLDGSISEKMAYAIVDRIIGRSDYVIDLHSMGDGWTEALSLVGYYNLPGDLGRKSHGLATMFPIETVYEMRIPSIGRLSDAAVEKGIPAMGTECTGGGVASNVEAYLTGIRNVMKHLDMIKGEPEGIPERRRLIRWREVKTSSGGFLETYVEVREQVTEGEKLGEITGIFNEPVSELEAPFNGIICAKSIKPVVRPGERIFLLG
jgi:predicted deacylase